MKTVIMYSNVELFMQCGRVPQCAQSPIRAALVNTAILNCTVSTNSSVPIAA